MALRSPSLSGLTEAPAHDPLSNLQPELPLEETDLTRHSGTQTPEAEHPLVDAVKKPPGRPKKEKAATKDAATTTDTVTAAVTPAKKVRATKPTAVDGRASLRDLRAQLKMVESEFTHLKEQIDAAKARFQPRIDLLTTQHDALSAAIAAALLK